MSDRQPIFILPESTERTSGKDAQRNNILAARLVSDAVKTTLGPKGMDKMLVDTMGDITVTNDGVTILDKMDIEHPAAKMMVEIAKTQESEVGDGTTTAVMLAGRLLEHAERLLDMKIHPTVIVKGYTLAVEKVKKLLDELSISISENREDILRHVVMTAMTGKGAERVKESFADIIVRAVTQVGSDGEFDMNAISIVKQKSEGVEDTELISGIVIDKGKAVHDMPSHVTSARIVLLSEGLESRSLENDTKISITSPDQFEQFSQQEERYLQGIVEKISAVGANVVFCQKGVDSVVEYMLAKKNMYVCKRVSLSDMELLSQATGARILGSVSDLSEQDLGRVEKVAQVKKGDEYMTEVTGCENPRAMTIVVHGGSDYVLDEMERALKDGLGDVATVLKDGKVVPGAGAIEMSLAKGLREFAQSVSGREQLAIQEFAHALEYVPHTLSENAGLDPIDIVTELKSRHDHGDTLAGINIFTNRIEDVLHQGIIEPMRVKKQALISATEVATMILRIDDVLASKGSPRGPAGSGAGFGAPGMM